MTAPVQATSPAAPAKTVVPAWFSAALTDRGRDHVLVVDGVRVAYRVWGGPGRPVVVLVHGGGAHAGWWDHVAPHLAQHHRVLAVDLSGHGDSSWRTDYSLGAWVDEIVAVAAKESPQPPVLIGHSMGGFVVLRAAMRLGSTLRGVVSIDAPVGERPASEPSWAGRVAGVVNRRTHPNRETILSRFRTLPSDEASLPFVLDHIALHSVTEVESGWSWKFDPRALVVRGVLPDEITPAGCTVALVRGERGMQTQGNADALAARLAATVPVVTVVDAGHHVMLDQPIALTAVLAAFIEQWRDTPGGIEEVV